MQFLIGCAVKTYLRQPFEDQAKQESRSASYYYSSSSSCCCCCCCYYYYYYYSSYSYFSYSSSSFCCCCGCCSYCSLCSCHYDENSNTHACMGHCKKQKQASSSTFCRFSILTIMPLSMLVAKVITA